jgi:hypothetical protein
MWDLVRQCQLRVQHLELPTCNGYVLWLGHGAENVYDFESLAKAYAIRVVSESSGAAATGDVHDVWRTGDRPEGYGVAVKSNFAHWVA